MSDLANYDRLRATEAIIQVTKEKSKVVVATRDFSLREVNKILVYDVYGVIGTINFITALDMRH